MKNTLLFGLLSVILTGFVYNALSKSHLPIRNNNNYTLTIDQRKIGKLHDTIIFKRKYWVSYIPIKMSNNSNNVLNYITYSCSWDDLFHSNNKAIEISHVPCQSNYPIVQNLDPHKSITFNLPVLLNSKATRLKFKAGMNLFFDNLQNRQLFPLPVDKLDNTIWSNEITIP